MSLADRFTIVVDEHDSATLVELVPTTTPQTNVAVPVDAPSARTHDHHTKPATVTVEELIAIGASDAVIQRLLPAVDADALIGLRATAANRGGTTRLRVGSERTAGDSRD